MLILVLLAFGGGIGVDRMWLMTQANSEFAAAMDRNRQVNAETVAAERRLVEARTAREREMARFTEVASATDMDKCPAPDDVQRMLNSAAEATRTGSGARVPAGGVSRPSD